MLASVATSMRFLSAMGAPSRRRFSPAIRQAYTIAPAAAETPMPHNTLRTILPFAGLSAARADAVEFTGGTDPILPTSFRISATGAAALAATGLAAADLWELRTGRKQSVA